MPKSGIVELQQGKLMGTSWQAFSALQAHSFHAVSGVHIAPPGALAGDGTYDSVISVGL